MKGKKIPLPDLEKTEEMRRKKEKEAGRNL